MALKIEMKTRARKGSLGREKNEVREPRGGEGELICAAFLFFFFLHQHQRLLLQNYFVLSHSFLPCSSQSTQPSFAARIYTHCFWTCFVCVAHGQEHIPPSVTVSLLQRKVFRLRCSRGLLRPEAPLQTDPAPRPQSPHFNMSQSGAASFAP